MIKFFLISLLLLFQMSFLTAQNSFLREISGLEGLGFFHPLISNGANGDLSVVLPMDGGFALLVLSPEGNAIESYNVSATNQDSYWMTRRYNRAGNYQLVGGGGLLVLGDVPYPSFLIFMVNTETGEKWAKKVFNTDVMAATASVVNTDKVVMPYYLEGNYVGQFYSMGLSFLDLATGNEIWSYYYRPEMLQSYDYFIFNNAEEFPNGDFSVLLNRGNEHGQRGAFFLNRMSIDGDVKKSVVIEQEEGLVINRHDTDAMGNVYLSGGIDSPELGYKEGFVAKMDKDYHLLWAKKLTAEAFPLFSIKLKVFPNGEVVFAYVTLGDLPVIVGKISTDGDLSWYRGYSFYTPEITIGQDSSIFFSSPKKYFEDGSSELSPIVAKTTPGGIIEGCDQFDACLDLVNIALTFTEKNWERFDVPGPQSIPVSIAPITFSATPHCGIPPPPKATFSLPDTLCQYSCVEPDSLKNQLANHVEWTIEGPGVDTTIVDTTFNWCFDIPGTYSIEQEVWLLGCSEFFSHTLEVLPDNLEVSLGGNRVFCELPYRLMPEGSRPLQSFSWYDGSEAATLSVVQSGDYSLIATDGYCEAGDTVTLTFVEDLIDEPPLVLPQDERTCPVFVPYTLRPQSPYSTTFLLNDTLQDSVFNLTESGVYSVGVEIENCLFFDEFRLEIEDCNIPIYFGNAFSPNDDGINDLIFPQGQDFEGKELQIFDRWGNLLYQTRKAPFSWDGTSGGKDMNAGVYLMVFTYFNQLNLAEEVISGDVLLLR